MFLTKEATTQLTDALHLPATGREQDWDIELANADRVQDFVQHMMDQPLGPDVKLALMALILASLEDYSYKQEVPAELWRDVRQLLAEDAALYVDLVRQWSMRDGHSFMISPRMQSL